MITSLHGISTMHGNLMTDIRLAKEAGFNSLEIFYPKFIRYLQNGGTITEVKNKISDAGLTVSFLSALDNIERFEKSERVALLAEAEKISQEARQLGTNTVMILPRNGIDHLSDGEIMDIMTDNITAIATIGERLSVRYIIELPAFTKFRTLQQAHEVIRRVGKKNVGVVVDFWHFYAAGCTPEEVSRMNKEHIFGVHFCDGRVPKKAGDSWDETILRSCMPGEGEIDLKKWSDAVKTTGFDGAWSVELISPSVWEKDPSDITKALCQALHKYAA
ncbi:sugar phosphate isomerase/epimerase family protein [Erwinia mallotivora]|uniref:Xylose isomerase n=1 Tax=Erwinia mallotivora TaxID=69222 RepID=A0A014N3B5_9GAMM|nr:sugar phosphate isomerase/epimerase family protein [Erwinia mallotivora]EXU73893.1 xylose isomerase [Erwinia mallotivora]